MSVSVYSSAQVKLTQNQSQSLNAFKVRMLDGHHSSIGKQLLWVVVYQLPAGTEQCSVLFNQNIIMYLYTVCLDTHKHTMLFLYTLP